MKLIQLLILLSLISCESQSGKILIEKNIEKELELNMNADDMSGLTPGNNGYFTFSSMEMNRLFEEADGANSIDKMLSEKEEILQPNGCSCQLKNDTIIISGGIFYGGGLGYQVKIHENEFDGEIILASTSAKFTLEKGDDLLDEIYLKSDEQKLFLTEDPVFELNKIVKGKIVMESQDFLSKDKNALIKDKYWMKVLFECELHEHGPF